MEKIRTKVKIKSRNWNVIFDDPAKKVYLANKDLGFDINDGGSTVEGTIYINSTLDDEQVYAKLKHELVHAYVWSYGFYYVKWDEENMAVFNETYMEDIIYDAKELFKYYQKSKKKREGR